MNQRRIFVCGAGAVSPAGWGMAALREALARGKPAATSDLPRPGWKHALKVRAVPPPSARPGFLAHPRLRRTSPIVHFGVAAALEALGLDPATANGQNGLLSPQAVQSKGARPRLGIVFCVMCGCVNFSRRFYDETLNDPAGASPVVFPETVFNAPASHLAALLGTNAANYTLVGDPGTFLQGLAVAADWLSTERVDGCLVIGAEELDWVTTDAFVVFHRRVIVSEGAGALYLTRQSDKTFPVELGAVTSARLFSKKQTRARAAQQTRDDLTSLGQATLLCDGLQGVRELDRDEAAAWQGWSGARLSPRQLLGEGRMAAAAWQCVAAVDMLRQGEMTAANVNVLGCNQQAIGARFVKATEKTKHC